MSAPSMKAALVDYFRQQPHITDAIGVTIHAMEGFLNSVSGVDPKKWDEFTGGFRYLSGGPWKNQNDVVVDEYYAGQRNLKVGTKTRFMNRDWNVAGIVENGKMSRLFLPIDLLQDLTSNPGKLSIIYLKVDNKADVDSVIASIKSVEEFKDYSIYSMKEYTSLISIDNAPGLRPFLNVIVGLAVVVGFLVVFLSFYTAVLERTREIGILKSLGATPMYVVGLLFREAIALSLIGSAFGIVLSYGSRWLIMTLVPASLQMQIVFEWWPTATLIAIGASLVGALYPGFKAAKQDAIEALAYE